jgi:hypothetical protein
LKAVPAASEGYRSCGWIAGEAAVVELPKTKVSVGVNDKAESASFRLNALPGLRLSKVIS